MNETPTSGPISTSMTHHARDVSSSRHSFSRSQTKGVLRKGKEDVFQVQGVHGVHASAELFDGALAADAAAAQEHEAIADPRGVADLVDGEKERPPARGVRAQGGADLARLAQVESIEGLV